MLKYYSFIVLLFFVFCSNVNAQDNNEILAKAGSVEIRVEDFRDRFEFMPHLNYSSDNPDSLKKEFLHSLIAEKLWYLEAMNENLDTLTSVEYSLKSLKKLFLRDELYRKEVESKIKISAEEISAGLLRLPRILNVDIISLKDSNEIFSIYNSLRFGVPFDSVKDPAGNLLQKTSAKVSFGKLEDEYIEELLFSLRKGEFSAPVFTNNNWFIFKLISEENNDIYNSASDHRRNLVYSTIKERKAKEISGVFLDEVIGGRSVSADKQLFLTMSDNLYIIISERLSGNGTDTSAGIQLIETDLMKLMKIMREDELSSTFIKFVENPSTLRDFLYYLIYQKIYFKSLEEKHFKGILSSAVKQFIEDEMIAEKASDDGLENLPSLKKDLQLWREYYLAEIMMQKFGKEIKISESDIAGFREKTSQKGGDLLYVNIIEILTDNPGEIETILDELERGKDIKDLADIYNKREWTKKSRGEWGYFPVSAGGEIGKITAGMNTGELYGPIKVPEGYSIFKLIGKETRSQNIKDTVDSKYIRMQLMLAGMNKLINSKTTELARKYGVSVDYDLLNKSEVSEINTFTYRFIGFGGKIAALPITIPLFEWYQEYINKKEL